MKYGYCITHEYTGGKPAIISVHRKLPVAESQLVKLKKRHVKKSKDAYVRYISPYKIRFLRDGQPGEVVKLTLFEGVA